MILIGKMRSSVERDCELLALGLAGKIVSDCYALQQSVAPEEQLDTKAYALDALILQSHLLVCVAKKVGSRYCRFIAKAISTQIYGQIEIFVPGTSLDDAGFNLLLTKRHRMFAKLPFPSFDTNNDLEHSDVFLEITKLHFNSPRLQLRSLELLKSQTKWMYAQLVELIHHSQASEEKTSRLAQNSLVKPPGRPKSP